MRRRAEEVAELAEDVRADHVAFVLGEIDPLGALADEDVEVIEPEVDQLFFELMICLLYTSPSPRDGLLSRMPSSA